jgi:hypothetical protein
MMLQNEEYHYLRSSFSMSSVVKSNQIISSQITWAWEVTINRFFQIYLEFSNLSKLIW